MAEVVYLATYLLGEAGRDSHLFPLSEPAPPIPTNTIPLEVVIWGPAYVPPAFVTVLPTLFLLTLYCDLEEPFQGGLAPEEPFLRSSWERDMVLADRPSAFVDWALYLLGMDIE